MPFTRLSQDFESNTDALIPFPGTITLEAAATVGVPAAGSDFHARLQGGGVFTRFDSYRSMSDSFERAFTSSIDIYLDPTGADA